MHELLSTSLLDKFLTSCAFPRSVEESRGEPVKANGQENGVVCSSEGFPNCSDGGSNILSIDSIIQEKGKSELELTNNNREVGGYGRDGGDMEKALEHQAQLIGQYEAMEKAQREWEEKFRENNSSTPVCCSITYFESYAL